MSIKGKCSFKLQTFHQGKTRAIGKAHVLIVIFSEQFKSSQANIVTDGHQAGNAALQQGITKGNCRLMKGPHANEGETFIHYIVTRNQFDLLQAYTGKFFNRSNMLLIFPVIQRQPGRGIHKQLHFSPP